MTDYLTVIEVAAIQQQLIDKYGGASGIRDRGALESSCYRPQSGYYENIIEQTSALIESLAMNHPFVDGNKRIAFAAADVFLRINGYKISADQMDVYHFMISHLEAGTLEMQNIKEFLEKNIS